MAHRTLPLEEKILLRSWPALQELVHVPLHYHICVEIHGVVAQVNESGEVSDAAKPQADCVVAVIRAASACLHVPAAPPRVLLRTAAC